VTPTERALFDEMAGLLRDIVDRYIGQGDPNDWPAAVIDAYHLLNRLPKTRMA
jgi:hypothetical protein